MGIEPYLLRSGLLAVVSQRLVRTLCDCAGDDRRPARPARPAGRSRTGSPSAARPAGGTGYRGRMVLAELLEPERLGLGPGHPRPRRRPPARSRWPSRPGWSAAGSGPAAPSTRGAPRPPRSAASSVSPDDPPGQPRTKVVDIRVGQSYSGSSEDRGRGLSTSDRVEPAAGHARPVDRAERRDGGPGPGGGAARPGPGRGGPRPPGPARGGWRRGWAIGWSGASGSAEALEADGRRGPATSTGRWSRPGSGRGGSRRRWRGWRRYARSFAETRRAIGLALLYPMMVVILAYGLFVVFIALGRPPVRRRLRDVPARPDAVRSTRSAGSGEHLVYWVPIVPAVAGPARPSVGLVGPGVDAPAGAARAGLLRMVPGIGSMLAPGAGGRLRRPPGPDGRARRPARRGDRAGGRGLGLPGLRASAGRRRPRRLRRGEPVDEAASGPGRISRRARLGARDRPAPAGRSARRSRHAAATYRAGRGGGPRRSRRVLPAGADLRRRGRWRSSSTSSLFRAAVARSGDELALPTPDRSDGRPTDGEIQRRSPSDARWLDPERGRGREPRRAGPGRRRGRRRAVDGDGRGGRVRRAPRRADADRACPLALGPPGRWRPSCRRDGSGATFEAMADRLEPGRVARRGDRRRRRAVPATLRGLILAGARSGRLADVLGRVRPVRQPRGRAPAAVLDGGRLSALPARRPGRALRLPLRLDRRGVRVRPEGLRRRDARRSRRPCS